MFRIVDYRHIVESGGIIVQICCFLLFDVEQLRQLVRFGSLSLAPVHEQLYEDFHHQAYQDEYFWDDSDEAGERP